MLDGRDTAADCGLAVGDCAVDADYYAYSAGFACY